MLHAIWSDARLVIWAESLQRFLLLADSTATSSPGGLASTETAAAATAVATGVPIKVHPFAMDATQVRAELVRLCPDLAPLLKAETAFVVRLPRDLLGPWPSDGLANLVGGVETPDGPSLGEFMVPGLAIEAGDVARVILAITRAAGGNDRAGAANGGREEERSGERIELGPTLAWWRAVSLFALDLLADQRFIPSLRQNERAQLNAIWRPWLHDEEVCRRLAAVLASMPPLLRSVRDDLGEGAWTRLESALVGLIDGTIRRTLIAEDFVDSIVDRQLEDPHVAWLSGLLGKPSRVGRDGEAGRALFRDARRWISRLDDISGDLEYRLWLNLQAPAEASGETWRLDVGLHSAVDPTVQLSAEDVWTQSPEALGSAAESAEPQDVLVTELGRAARMYPVLEPLLAQATPSGLDLDTATAATFLTEFKPLLEESGCVVTAPPWWGTTAGGLGLRLEIESDDLDIEGQTSRPGLDSMVAYRWQVAVGDQPLSLEELRGLSMQRLPLVQMHGQWVEVDPDQIAKAIAFLDRSAESEQRMRLIDALRLASGGRDEETGLAITGVTASGWVSELLGTTAGSILDNIKQPDRFVGTLRPYQIRGLGWLSFLDRIGLGACLADDMGLGKTVQLIALLQWERANANGGPMSPTLLVVPTSVIGNWQRELNRFAPELTIHIHHGPTRPVGDVFTETVDAVDVVITTYALVGRDQDTLQAKAWHRVVLDEAQYIKNPPTKQTSAIRAIETERRIALTGTPVENRLSELWSIMEFCNPGYLGEASEFRRRFARPIERHRDSRQADQLKRLVQPFILRRLKTDRTVITDLPECVETREFATLSHEQATLYEKVVEGMLGRVDRSDGIQRRGLILAMLGKLKQICDHPALAQSGDDLAHLVKPDGEHLRSLSSRSGKARRMMTLLEEVLAAGERALVFTQYRRMGKLLTAMVEHDLGCESLFLHGGTPVAKRQKMIDGFQDPDSNTPVFVLSLKAGGLGLNLTAANHVFHFDRWWNPAVERQATDRAFRIGQVRTVHVHKFVCIGTLEERIDQMIQEKTALAENIIGSGDAWLTEMSTGQLRDVLMLRVDSMEMDG